MVILGSTGSVGQQALDVCEHLQIPVVALSAGRDIVTLEAQIRKFRPALCGVADPDAGALLKTRIADLDTRIVTGKEAAATVAEVAEADTVLNAVSGIAGLRPTLATLSSGKRLALANKESLVTHGTAVMAEARKRSLPILPVDSEHSAIFQCLSGQPIRRILLTASGGPFFGKSRKELAAITPADALNHPTWSMGSRITIDSATMMNKGLEIIEAKWLFDVPLEQIQVVIHPQSILHSAVEYEDGSVVGQMGVPSMIVPIAYAFSYPERIDLLSSGTAKSLDLFSLPQGMTFYPADETVFKTTALARQASETGGSCPVVLNGANEVLVDLFLHQKIRFVDIQDTLERILNEHVPKFGLDLEGVLEEDRKIRDYVRKLV